MKSEKCMFFKVMVLRIGYFIVEICGARWGKIDAGFLWGFAKQLESGITEAVS